LASSPRHGEVDNDEIVLGYEYDRGRYVEVDPEEIDRLRTKREKELRLEAFIRSRQLDPIYFDGRMHYLVPAEVPDREPYQLLRHALDREGMWGVGQVVFSGKEQLVIVRPRDGLLAMAMLNYAPEIRRPQELAAAAGHVKLSVRNLKLAEELIDSMAARTFDIADYEDTYQKRILALLESKRRGRELVTPPEEDEHEVINLVDALRKSIERSNGHAGTRSRRRHKRACKP